MKPAASIIIRCRNEERLIGQALDAVFSQSIGLSFEVIVIDSGSTDRTLDIVRKFDVRLYEIPPGQFTFGHALNYGAGLAEGEYIINLSAHCIPVSPTWMSKLLKPMMDDSSIVATFGRQEPIKGLNPFEEITLLAGFLPDEDGNIVPAFSNSNCAIRKNVWMEYAFDEKAAFAEDFIWAKRLPSGHKIKYIPDASVYHSHPLVPSYWKNRYYSDGLAACYMKYAYDIRFPWIPSGNKADMGFIMRILTTIRSCWAELRHINSFLTSQGYSRHMLLSPVFVIIRRYYYGKGLKDGEKRYAPASR